MASSIAELKIGPFSGGINTASDGSAIADNELVDCVNFDVDLDGSLKSRPPWRVLYGIQTSVTDTTAPKCSQTVLGTFVYGGVRFILFTLHIETTTTITDSVRIYYMDGVNAGNVVQIGTGRFSRAIRYGDDIYIVPDINTTHGGLKYSLNDGVVTVLATMPTGYSAAVYKDRLWITGRRAVVTAQNNVTGGSSRLFFSNLGDFTGWPTSQFFDINPGDGDATQELVVYQDNLLIFKDSATYVLAYDTQPTAATLLVVNPDIGVQGPRTVVSYENSVFLQMHNKVYEMANYDFNLISVKMPFEYDTTVPTTAPYGTSSQSFKWPIFISLVGDRLISRFYNRLYIYHTRLRAWTRYESNDTNIHYLGPIVELDSTNAGPVRGWKTFIATSALTLTPDSFSFDGTENNWFRYTKLFIMEDRYEESNTEFGNTLDTTPVDIDLDIKTKIYDIGVSHRFKRLFHWGVDVITGKDVTGILTPFSIEYRVTWETLHNYHWHDLQTWGYPLYGNPATTQIQPVESGLYRRFIRFPKSLRFRLLQFQVQMMTSGSTVDGPARLYSLTAFIASKQLVPKTFN
jgi:hypothetical protein